MTMNNNNNNNNNNKQGIFLCIQLLPRLRFYFQLNLGFCCHILILILIDISILLCHLAGGLTCDYEG